MGTSDFFQSVNLSLDAELRLAPLESVRFVSSPLRRDPRRAQQLLGTKKKGGAGHMKMDIYKDDSVYMYI